ncbi:MAG TPA: dihydropteroate synthase [Actinomycetota bacterium]|nr:dihydropteroate synthase [Actinomycetota bacterium]
MTGRLLPQGRCAVMGIVNRTPDSFYDGGRMDLEETLDHAAALVEEGADLLDIGVVRAGPGPAVSPDEEWELLRPVLEGLADERVPLSVETRHPVIAERALGAGASIINDVGSGDPGVAAAVASAGAGLVVMHNGGQIRSRPRHPAYKDVVAEVNEELHRRAQDAVELGVPHGSVIVDPGPDFGKTTFHSLELMRRLDETVALGWPVLVAVSRKDVVGETLDLPPGERLEGSLALAALAVERGAAVVRTHDVQATVRVVQMVEAVMGRRIPAAPLRGLWD